MALKPAKTRNTGAAIGAATETPEGTLGDNWMDDAWRQTDWPSLARYLTNPGEDIPELMMRSNLFSDQEINAAILFLYKCDLIGSKKGRELLRNKLAARCSLFGDGRKALLTLGTGQFPPGGIPMTRDGKSRFRRAPKDGQEVG